MFDYMFVFTLLFLSFHYQNVLYLSTSIAQQLYFDVADIINACDNRLTKRFTYLPLPKIKIKNAAWLPAADDVTQQNKANSTRISHHTFKLI